MKNNTFSVSLYDGDNGYCVVRSFLIFGIRIFYIFLYFWLKLVFSVIKFMFFFCLLLEVFIVVFPIAELNYFADTQIHRTINPIEAISF